MSLAELRRPPKPKSSPAAASLSRVRHFGSPFRPHNAVRGCPPRLVAISSHRDSPCGEDEVVAVRENDVRGRRR
ncbi:hypothetical protein L484_022579 [Morus notabilis]|uniref:Uncharacterized protein n=1 Tax=Morus notabilis TaxID=981085 RepID=W9R892_9ROSA|nr:hypothetical protein L484_022579 [Morus notabilis]